MFNDLKDINFLIIEHSTSFLLKKLLLIFILILFLSAKDLDHRSISLNELPKDLSLKNHDLMSLDNQVVEVKGFWYPLSDKKGLLSLQPHLKSCCIQASPLIYQQIIVKGEVSSFPLQKAITVEGIFKIEPLHDLDGRLIQYYTLSDARQISSPHSLLFALLLSIGVMISLYSVLKISKITSKKFIFNFLNDLFDYFSR